MRKILLIVSGSVATIKVFDLIEELKKNKYEIKLLTTSSGMLFILALLFRDPFKIPVFLKYWECSFKETLSFFKMKRGDVPHIESSKWANCILVAPASCNYIAKIVNGITDNYSLCVIRALKRGKICFIAPAMNTEMWHDPFMQKNLDALHQTEKYKIISPQTKKLFCGDMGIGAMASLEDIVKSIEL